MSGAILPMIPRIMTLPPDDRRRRPRRGSRADAGTHATMTPRQVLIVEDEALVALTLEAMVQDIGHSVTALAADARTALRLAVSLSPDIVLMDVRLGAAGDEGIAAAVAIRARTSAQIIFVTAYANPGMVARINAALPAAPVLMKPISALELARVIEEASRGT